MTDKEYTSASLCMDIIQRLEHRPEIWQFRHPLYKKRIVHQKFWENMAEELGVSDDILRRRWKHLKDQYRKELQRALETGDELVQWQYFRPLSFYREEVLYRFKERAMAAAIDDVDDTSSEPETADVEMVQEKPRPVTKPQPVIKPQPVMKPRPTVQTATANPPSLNTPEGRQARIEILKQKRESRLKIAAVNKQLIDSRADLQIKVEQLEKRIMDPDYMYLLSIVPSMKRLTEIQKLQLKGKINDWLLAAITENEHGKNTHVNSNIKSLDVNNLDVHNHDDLITIIKCDDDIITIKNEPVDSDD